MNPWLIDSANSDDLERYLIAQHLVTADALPVTVAPAGAGNMNLALRVRTGDGRTFILKQGRPWVAKYSHIPAPFERTLVEAAFYRTVAGHPLVSSRMPALLHVDSVNHVIVLEDVGTGGDCTPIYNGATLDQSTVNDLLDWLDALARVTLSPEARLTFHNRSMRALNHEHIFELPLRAGNGLDLDGITPGLAAAASDLTADRRYCDAVSVLAHRYLDDGARLVHGDFFPGSWLRQNGSVRVIDPEFCFVGDREFDYGVLAAHLMLADCSTEPLAAVSRAVTVRRLDPARVSGFAGVEIMRRLIGVAQLPMTATLERKRRLLDRSRRLVTEPERGLL